MHSKNQVYAKLNNCVFNPALKSSQLLDRFLTETGSEFYIVGAAILKLRVPNLLVVERGVTRSPWLAARKWALPWQEEVGVSSSLR